jgi:hypothetical protein
VTSVNDAMDEDDETVILDIQSVTNGIESGVQQKIIAITDDDNAPSVSFSGTGGSILETGGTATITATLSAISGKTIVIMLTKSGTATDVLDYTLSNTTIIIPAGSTTGSVTLTAVDDAIAEGNETIILDIQSVTNGTELGTQQQIYTIVDNERVGVADNPAALQIKIYPTWVSDGLTITTEVGNITDLQIVNLSGQIIRTASNLVMPSPYRVDLSELSNGVYMVRVRNSVGAMQIAKIVKF